jgi:hypothetical protein
MCMILPQRDLPVFLLVLPIVFDFFFEQMAFCCREDDKPANKKPSLTQFCETVNTVGPIAVFLSTRARGLCVISVPYKHLTDIYICDPFRSSGDRIGYSAPSSMDSRLVQDPQRYISLLLFRFAGGESIKSLYRTQAYV